MKDFRTGRRLISVKREIAFSQPPIARDDPRMEGVAYVGVVSRWELQLRDDAGEGKVALCRFLQAPVGATAIVPVNRALPAEPPSYGRACGGWQVRANHVAWRFGGKANVKFGIGVQHVTGWAGILRQLREGRLCLLIREYLFGRGARYGNHPFGYVRDDQVVQVLDCFAFGELEYHSPVLDAGTGPRRLSESDNLWAFAGGAEAIAALGVELLGVDINPYIFRRGRA